MSWMLLASMLPISSAMAPLDCKDQVEMCSGFNSRDSPTLAQTVWIFWVRTALVTLCQRCTTFTAQKVCVFVCVWGGSFV